MSERSGEQARTCPDCGALCSGDECSECGHHFEQRDEQAALASLRRQVESVEQVNRDMGYPVPSGALICLRYSEARALLDLSTRPGKGDAQ